MQIPDQDRAAPAYWVRQRNGLSVGAHESAEQAEKTAAEVAEMPIWYGSHLAPTGLTWIELDRRGPGGFSYWTLTPVWERT